MPRVLPVTREQVLEWIDNPVTLVFKQFAQQELEETLRSQGLGAYAPFEPQRTQEVLANLNGARDVWEDVVEALEGEGLMEEENEE